LPHHSLEHIATQHAIRIKITSSEKAAYLSKLLAKYWARNDVVSELH